MEQILAKILAELVKMNERFDEVERRYQRPPAKEFQDSRSEERRIGPIDRRVQPFGRRMRTDPFESLRALDDTERRKKVSGADPRRGRRENPGGRRENDN